MRNESVVHATVASNRTAAGAHAMPLSCWLPDAGALSHNSSASCRFRTGVLVFCTALSPGAIFVDAQIAVLGVELNKCVNELKRRRLEAKEHAEQMKVGAALHSPGTKFFGSTC